MLTTGGGTRIQFEEQIKELCPVGTKPGDDPAAVAEQAGVALGEAQGVIEENNGTLNDAFFIFRVINGILQGIQLAAIAFPQLRVVSVPARVAQVQVASIMTRINAQKAANDAAFQRFQQIKELQQRRAA